MGRAACNTWDMGKRPLTARGAATRGRIVAAAADAVHEQGIAGASLEDVLGRAGAGKGQLYHFFDGKEDLMREVHAHQAELVVAPQTVQLDAVRTADELLAWAEAVVEWHAARNAPGCPVGLLAAHLGDDAELGARVDATFTEWTDAVARALSRLSRDGEIATEQPDADAALLVAAIQGGGLIARARGNAAPLKTAVAAALRAIGVPGRDVRAAGSYSKSTRTRRGALSPGRKAV